MRIVQLVYSLSSGGAERFTVDLSNELALQGHDVYLVIFRSGEKAEFYRSLVSRDVRLINMDIKPGFSLLRVARVMRSIYRISPDVVHSHLNVIPYIYLMALLSRKVAFIHTLHSLAEYVSGGRIQAKINRLFYWMKLIHPVAISKTCSDSYGDYYRLPVAPVIENGRSKVDATSLISQVEIEFADLLAGRDIPIFLHVARFDEYKNQDLLVSAFNRLHEDGVDFLLLIIGRGYDQAGKAQQLRDKACGSIRFLGEKKNVGDYFLLADAFCLSSSHEGLPISLIEALSSGCVPICTAVGGIPDIIKDGETGFLSSGIDVDSYCHAIRRYLADPEFIDKGFLKSVYAQRYSIGRCAESYLDFYKECL